MYKKEFLYEIFSIQDVLLPVMRRAVSVLGSGGVCELLRATMGHLDRRDSDEAFYTDKDGQRIRRSPGGLFLHLIPLPQKKLITGKKKKKLRGARGEHHPSLTQTCFYTPSSGSFAYWLSLSYSQQFERRPI